MELLADTWVLWLIVCIATLVAMVFFRQNRRNIATFSTAEDFSVGTIFLNLRKGEADLFLGFLVAIVSFSLFVAGLLRWVPSMLG